MIKLQFHIQRYELTPRNHAAVMREMNRNVMVRHQYERLPKHFEESGFAEYGFQPRAAKYTKAKKRSKGHAKPNVFTGTLKRSVFAKIKITATQNGSKLTTRGTVKSRLQEWQRREIQKLSDKEKKLEYRQMARDYKKLATSEKYRRKRSRRTK